MDARISELRRENEALRLSLFWKDHNLPRLRERMADANDWHANAPHCRCLACAVAGRVDDMETFPENGRTHCLFKEWFEAKLAACGLVAAFASPEALREKPVVKDELGGGPMFAVDAHFQHASERDDWFNFTFGQRLWQAESADDPELAKLRRLFEVLDE